MVALVAVALAGCSVGDSAPTVTLANQEIVIEGTRAPYTFEETQAYGEFGPFLWGLVTTLNGIDDIPHGETYEWVTWGPQWAGHQPDPGPFEVYGVTDLDAVDTEAIGAVVPVGTTIVLRQVEWSLDELEEFAEMLWEAAPENGVCSTGFGRYPNRVRVEATEDLDLGDVPPGAVAIEYFDVCVGTVPAG
jgi:hypothetical protein